MGSIRKWKQLEQCSCVVMESIRKWKEERELQCSWSGSCRVRGHVKASRGVECDGVLKFLCVEVAGNRSVEVWKQ